MAAFSDNDLVDIFQAALRGERNDIHTAFPGIVKAYYPATQLADITPALLVPQFTEDGTRIPNGGRTLPMLPNVPVIWPRAGGYFHVMPLTAGDFVWIMFSEAGTGEYRLSGQASEPFDVSRHTITYPVCTPGACPDIKKLTDASVTCGAVAAWGKTGGPQIQIDGTTINFSPTGSTSDPGDAPALASIVDANFTAIKNYLTTNFGTPGGVVAPSGGGSCVIANGSPVPTLNATKSALIKCQ